MPRPRKTRAPATRTRVKRVATRKSSGDHKAERNTRSAREAVVATAGLDDAPIEAWQQAMLPHLQEIAEASGLSECAYVFLCLLRLKPFKEIHEFEQWMHRVTGYPLYQIRGFVRRATQNHLIVNGQLNAKAFRLAASDDETGIVEWVMLTRALEGQFCRNAAGEYSLPEETA